ncbi:hypothetical protein ACFXTO_045133 [Malus domestica]
MLIEAARWHDYEPWCKIGTAGIHGDISRAAGNCGAGRHNFERRVVMKTKHASGSWWLGCCVLLMLITGLAANEHFASEIDYDDNQNVALTVNAGVYTARRLGSWLVEELLAWTLLERFVVCPYPALRHLI